MKNKILAFVLMSFISVHAQEVSNDNNDKIVETETRILNVMEDGEMIQKKVKVRTTKVQEIVNDTTHSNGIDSNRVFPATKVSKVIYIDNDDDPFYESKSKVTYYKKNGIIYNFKPTTNGFEIRDSKSNAMIGNARFSNNSGVYLLDSGNYTGIGYFQNGMFIIEYYDDEGTLIVEKFNDNKL